MSIYTVLYSMLCKTRQYDSHETEAQDEPVYASSEHHMAAEQAGCPVVELAGYASNHSL